VKTGLPKARPTSREGTVQRIIDDPTLVVEDILRGFISAGRHHAGRVWRRLEPAAPSESPRRIALPVA
jgi:hypothetical protein